MGIDLVSRGTGLINQGTADKISAGVGLVSRGLGLFTDISAAGNKPGGPTDEDVAAVRQKYNISDDQLHQLLTGGADG